MKSIKIRSLTARDQKAFRQIRLESLKNHPEAFGSSYEDAVKFDDAWWANWFKPSLPGGDSVLFLAMDGEKIVAIAAAWPHRGAKVGHTATISSVYVKSAYRGKGLADRLINKCVAWCKTKGFRNVTLTATAGNAAAIRCYVRCGFKVYGVAPEVIRVGDVYHDEIMMWRPV